MTHAHKIIYLLDVFIISGAIFLVISAFHIIRILKLLPPKPKKPWKTLICLITFFLLGYIIYGIHIFTVPHEHHKYIALVSLIFFFCGIFIFLVTRLSLKAITNKTLRTKIIAHKNLITKHIYNRLQNIIDTAAESIITFDDSATILSFNYAAEKLFALKASDAIGQAITTLFKTDDTTSTDRFIKDTLPNMLGTESELTGIRSDKTTFPALIHASTTATPAGHTNTFILTDISEHKHTLNNLQFLASHDFLTGMDNRPSFEKRLEQAINDVQRNHENCYLFYIDIDNFKYINDTQGHNIGDKVLIETAAFLQTRIRKTDTLARLGGDEFVILITHTTKRNVTKLANNIRNAIAKHDFSRICKQSNFTISIGITLIDKTITNTKTALSYADFACQKAKLHGRNQCYKFTSLNQQSLMEISQNLGWTERIKQALDNDTFELALQPIQNLRTNEIVMHEVLLHMRDEAGNLIMPNTFIVAAERFGLIYAIDEMVITKTVNYITNNKDNTQYSINLSPTSITQPTLMQHIRNAIMANNINPANLIFEITEAIAIENMDAVAKLFEQLKQLGCKTALDDFGTGMSSFAYLQQISVDYIKIDGAFTQNIAKNSVNQAIVRAINDITHNLGKKTIAEQIENSDDLNQLKQYGINYAQGDLIGKPETISNSGKMS